MTVCTADFNIEKKRVSLLHLSVFFVSSKRKEEEEEENAKTLTNEKKIALSTIQCGIMCFDYCILATPTFQFHGLSSFFPVVTTY